ncbi:Trk system potassium uptake protein TrkG [Clostridium homopropionicum DSM 5847]|uniref:Trk system potassium uptake protein TrkG n=1 Tax=Clostridium homopropionicum DSM 5847 TaxID=1121318 RepID=A0A0L6ZCZ7_9CLOT|nr:TrkH family potassium uptake protein [Clostridium homopropionicum]KOA20846.1 Trk system potassium uptake protein TrkG [Clostridium homopropionicum DSM 5847]SFF87603.1 trk system potassium uptake protein TrkH [Clostridium homopropionicum]
MLYLDQLKQKYQLIIGYIGIITIGAGIVLIIPLISLFFYTDEVSQGIYFIIPSAVSIVLGILMSNRLKNRKVISLTVQDGGIIVVLSWIVAIIISSFPFTLSGMLNFTQAVFECTSGWTTTGLSVVDVTKAPKVFLLWRSIMQFFGGAGLAVVMLSTIIGPLGMGLYTAEARSDKLLPNIKKTTSLIMKIYSGYIIAGIILYVIAGMSIFDAINHSIAAVSTGGFSTKVNSIGEYKSPIIELITIILMILGTTNFAAHYLILKGKVKRFFRIGEVRFMFFLMSLSIPLLAFYTLRGLYTSLGRSFRIAIFEATSAISTTGFSTVTYTNWNDFGIFVMVILMIIGGGTGSTAGGLKLYRAYVLIKSLLWNIKGFLLPKYGVKENYVFRPDGKYYVKDNHLVELGNFLIMYVITYFIGVCIITLSGYPLRDAMFEIASSLSTVGLSVGVTSANVSGVVLWTESVLMLLGRLEFFVIFYTIAKVIKDTKLVLKK